MSDIRPQIVELTALVAFAGGFFALHKRFRKTSLAVGCLSTGLVGTAVANTAMTISDINSMK